MRSCNVRWNRRGLGLIACTQLAVLATQLLPGVDWPPWLWFWPLWGAFAYMIVTLVLVAGGYFDVELEP